MIFPLRGPLASPCKVGCEVSSEQAPCLPVPNVIPAYAIPLQKYFDAPRVLAPLRGSAGRARSLKILLQVVRQSLTVCSYA